MSPYSLSNPLLVAVRLAVVLILAFCAMDTCRAERQSNGIGGGNWSDPGSWRENQLPAPTDTVVIVTGDTITFDADHPTNSSCASLLLDPQATLDFKSDAARHIMRVSGPIESYGAIKLDAGRSPQSRMELILDAPSESNRVIRLQRNGVLLALGVRLPGSARNVAITAKAPAETTEPETATIQASAANTLELNRTILSNIIVTATGIDNTGAKPNERLNLLENRFVNQARIVVTYSDSPAIRRNIFDGIPGAVISQPAIYLNVCKLAQAEGNVITGLYATGIVLATDTESSLTENTIVGATRGLYVHGRSSMLKRNIIEDSAPAIHLDSAAEAVLEDTTIRGPALAIRAVNSSAQITNMRVLDSTESNILVRVAASRLTILNTPITVDRLKFDSNGSVSAMNYIVVRVKGRLPKDATLEARTAASSGGPPKGKADLNVRNSPVPISPAGLTPLPVSGKALIVQSWACVNNRPLPSPFYDLNVMAPGATPDAPPRLLKSIVVEPKPAWYRDDANQPEPTVEITLP